MENNMVNVYFYGKKYSVPGDLTIMTAMEYAGYTLTRGCGCRHGFCGACATIYRIKGKNELKTCLACQTQVVEGMYVASIPSQNGKRFDRMTAFALSKISSSSSLVTSSVILFFKRSSCVILSFLLYEFMRSLQSLRP